ncbi:MAG: response regulator [Saccharospirillaceae bacterium]|nr:response regulator [Pseudomonadales bacterium]NRB78455.1 response regulator [Saccharospirillaceae bacterium]
MSLSEHILIVEDDVKVAHVLTRLLQANGYQTFHIDHGDKVLPWLNVNETQLILLDVMLPGKTGIELCSLIRKNNLVPIIMLTAMKEEIDQINGLEHGANDYITKPFSINNVMARVKTNLRFSQQLAQQTPKSKGVFFIDLNGLCATLHKQPLELTHSEFRILNALHKNQGKVYSRQELIDVIYDDHRVVSDRTIDTHVKSLRKKIALVDKFEFIQSAYGKGYKFLEEKD